MKKVILISLFALTFLQADVSVNVNDSKNISNNADISGADSTNDSVNNSNSEGMEARDTNDTRRETNSGTSESVRSSLSTAEGFEIRKNLIPTVIRLLIDEEGFSEQIAILQEKDFGVVYTSNTLGNGMMIHDNMLSSVSDELSKTNTDVSTFANKSNFIKAKSPQTQKFEYIVEEIIQASNVVLLVLKEAQALELTFDNYNSILKQLVAKHSNAFTGQLAGVEDCRYNGNRRNVICNNRYILNFESGSVVLKDTSGIVLSTEQVQNFSGNMSLSYSGTVDEAYEETFGNMKSNSLTESVAEFISENEGSSHSEDVAIVKKAAINFALTHNEDAVKSSSIKDLELQKSSATNF